MYQNENWIRLEGDQRYNEYEKIKVLTMLHNRANIDNFLSDDKINLKDLYARIFKKGLDEAADNT